jgi:hypothetical protein
MTAQPSRLITDDVASDEPLTRFLEFGCPKLSVADFEPTTFTFTSGSKGGTSVASGAEAAPTRFEFGQQV